MTEFSGWLLDLFEDPRSGIILWFIGSAGERVRLRQNFTVTFYAAGSPKELESLGAFLRTRPAVLKSSCTRRRDLYRHKSLPVLAVGGCGIISVAGHAVAERMQEMIGAYLAGDVKKAQTIHLELMPFFKVIFVTTNPIPIKTAVNLMGLTGGNFRPPMVPPTAAETEQLRNVMRNLHIIA